MTAVPEQKPPVNIRQITEEDIESVLAIDRKITGSDRALTYSAIPSSFVGGELEISVVAEAGGQIVGFLLGRITESSYMLADTALLKMIGVDPAYQRRGIGSALVQRFIERCQQKGVKSVHVLVSWHDWRLLSFLRSLGFARGEMAEFIKPIKD